jgi:ketosteroid isomerase-like protein
MKLLLAFFAFVAFASVAQATPTQDRAAILRTIDRMEAAWNRGDFKGYMAGFKKPDVVFVSGGKFQKDWQGTLDHYVRDYGGSAERRGKLHFYNMKVDILAPDAAMLIGQCRLIRGKRVTEGVNTRLFRKFGGKWLITMNHVSAYDVEPTPSASEVR